MKTKKICLIGIFCALSYGAMLISKLIPPISGFLQYDAKDIIIVISGFLLGPLCTLAVSIIEALLEMVTVSSTGPIGLLMNIIATLSFCFTASCIYKRKKSFTGAVISLAFGTIFLTVSMLLWNYLITPMYMNIERKVVLQMLPTVFLPFNIVKGSINSIITLILYKPVFKAFSKTNITKQAGWQ